MRDTGQFSQGEVFAGRYVVERLLKAGGMGAVYVVRHAQTHERLALKVMKPQLLSIEGARAKFEQEARVGATVQSAGVVRVVDAGVDQTSAMPYLVMELLQGHEVGDLLALRGRFRPSDVARILTQVARTLDKAHAAGVVHRDLKPENLFVVTATDDEPERVKILDFGIAKLLLAASSQTTRAQGTPFYMAPEQLGRGHIGLAADVWPLGLIAYTLLVGRSYWNAETIVSLYGEILRGQYEAASARAARLGVWLPTAFDGWFARCVALEPARRFASAGEASCELARVLESCPENIAILEPVISDVASDAVSEIPQQRPGSTEPSVNPADRTGGPWSGRRKTLVLGGVVGVLGLAGAAYFALRGFTKATTSVRNKPRVAEIAVGGDHACARLDSGKVLCWGSNAHGQLGDGTTKGARPTEVSNLADATGLGAGTAHTCAVRTDGRVSCWGTNRHGQLGSEDHQDATKPLGVEGLAGVTQVAGGHGFTCALAESGETSCWGGVYDGQHKPVVKVVQGLANATELGVAMYHACAVTGDGAGLCWGRNLEGQLNFLGENALDREVAVRSIDGVSQLAGGYAHTCARTTKGTVRCWGDPKRGALGSARIREDGTTVVEGLEKVEQIVAGYGHSCARTKDGRVFCWGANDFGQLGDGTNSHRVTPVLVSGLSQVVQVAASGNQTCALTEGAEVLCWGQDDLNQLGFSAQTSCAQSKRCSMVPGKVPL